MSSKKDEQLFFDFYDGKEEQSKLDDVPQPKLSDVISQINFSSEDEALDVLTGKVPITDILNNDNNEWEPCNPDNTDDCIAMNW